jgi:hypothetical protein
MGCKPIFLFCLTLFIFAVVPAVRRDQCFLIVRVVFQQFAAFCTSVCHGVDFVDVIPCADAAIACHPEFHIFSSFLCPCLAACFFTLLFYYIFILFSSLFCDFTHFFSFVFDVSLSFPIPSKTRRLWRGLAALRRPYFYLCAFIRLVSLCPQASSRRVRHVQSP